MLTPLQFSQRAATRFADNEFQYITEGSFRDFADDIRNTFVAQVALNVPDYEPGRKYSAGFIIRHSFAGATPVFLEAASAGLLPAPTAAAGDANWLAALSPASGPTLYQVGTVDGMRHAQNFWAPGRLYVLIGRTDSTGKALPDVYVRALSERQLEPEGYLFDKQAIGAGPVRVSYDLDTDETQPVVLDAYTKQEVDYLLDGQVGYLPDLPTVAKNNIVSSIRELSRQKVSIAALAPRIGPLAYFGSYAEAEQYALPGDTIYLSGTHASISVAKSVSLHGGNIKELTVGYRTGPLAVNVAGALCGGRIVTCVPTTNGGKHTVTYTNILTGPATFFEQFGLEGGASAWADVTISQTRLHNRAAYIAPANGVPAGGCVRFQERGGRYSRYNVLDSNLRSDNNAIGTGYPDPATEFVLAGSTDVQPGTGHGVQETMLLNSGVVQPDADILIEQRTGGGTSGGGLSGPGAGLSRTIHKTYAGRRYTGPLVIFSPPGPLSFVPLDANMYGYAFQVNYQDVARPGYWVAGPYLAEIADVSDALAAIPAASYPLGVQIRTAIVPQDTTIETLFYIDGLGAGFIEGSTTQFLVSYTGPPYGTLNANSQFREAFPSGWTSKAVAPTSVAIGGGLLIMAGSTSNNLEDLTMQPVTLMKDVTYKMLIGVASIGSNTTLNIGWREGGNSFVQVDYVSTLGENVLYFTPTFSSAAWYCHVWGAKDIQVTHMHILPA